MNHKRQLRLRSELLGLILFVASKWREFYENPGPQMRLHRLPELNKSINMWFWIKARWTWSLHELPLPKTWNYTQHQNLYGHHRSTSSGFLIRTCKVNMVGCPDCNRSIHGIFITIIHVFAPRHIYSFPVFAPPFPLASFLYESY